MSIPESLRARLRLAPNGLTTPQLALLIGQDVRTTRYYLNQMDDVISIGEVPTTNPQVKIKVWILVRTKQTAIEEPAPSPVDITSPRTVWVGGTPKWSRK